LYSVRISISAPISISLNVVSMAYVFCESFKRSAMRTRIFFILTRRSARASPLPLDESACLAGAGSDGFDVAGFEAAGGGGGGVDDDSDAAGVGFDSSTFGAAAGLAFTSPGSNLNNGAPTSTVSPSYSIYVGLTIIWSRVFIKCVTSNNRSTILPL
jgi:hypothetical protein